MAGLCLSLETFTSGSWTARCTIPDTGIGSCFCHCGKCILQNKVWWEIYEALSLNQLIADSCHRLAVSLALKVTRQVLCMVLAQITPQPLAEK